MTSVIGTAPVPAHQSALETALAAIKTVASVAVPVISSLAPEDAARANNGINLVTSVLTDLEALFRL